MGGQYYRNNKVQDQQPGDSLTNQEDWIQYYSGRYAGQIEDAAHRPTIIDDYLRDKAGRVFEMGCGGSGILARAALLGWEVGGIDFNLSALDQIRDYLSQNNYDTKNLLFGDIHAYECPQLRGEYDLLVSFGFLEHFKDPRAIIRKWKEILKNDGLVISAIPNLLSINAFLMRKFDPDLWTQHVPCSPEAMDQFHVDAGLVPMRKAKYCGSYSIYMLTPWERIQLVINNRYVFKLIKYFAHYGIGSFSRVLPTLNRRLFSPFVMGVYTIH